MLRVMCCSPSEAVSISVEGRVDWETEIMHFQGFAIYFFDLNDVFSEDKQAHRKTTTPLIISPSCPHVTICFQAERFSSETSWIVLRRNAKSEILWNLQRILQSRLSLHRITKLDVNLFRDILLLFPQHAHPQETNVSRRCSPYVCEFKAFRTPIFENKPQHSTIFLKHAWAPKIHSHQCKSDSRTPRCQALGVIWWVAYA